MKRIFESDDHRAKQLKDKVFDAITDYGVAGFRSCDSVTREQMEREAFKTIGDFWGFEVRWNKDPQPSEKP